MWLSQSIVLLIAVSHLFTISSAKTLPVLQRADANDDPYRLPKSVLPESYTVTIIAEENFAEKGEFTGSVSIQLTIVESVAEIVLHARFLEIDISKVVLTCGSVTDNIFESLTSNSSYHKISIKAKSELTSGSSCTLKFEEFKGELQDDMNGFYRSWYENENGEKE